MLDRYYIAFQLENKELHANSIDRFLYVTFYIIKQKHMNMMTLLYRKPERVKKVR